MIRSNAGYFTPCQNLVKTSHGKISTRPREGSVMTKRLWHFVSKPTCSVSLVGYGNRINQNVITKNLNNLNNLPVSTPKDGAAHVSV
jgi:hypothetical protein